jgi:hypothetical protein
MESFVLAEKSEEIGGFGRDGFGVVFFCRHGRLALGMWEMPLERFFYFL